MLNAIEFAWSQLKSVVKREVAVILPHVLSDTGRPEGVQDQCSVRHGPQRHAPDYPTDM